MALTLRLDAQAQRDFIDIRADVIERFGTRTADSVRAHLRYRINLLCEEPMMGVATNKPPIRILPLTRYPYRIYYTLTAEAVVILHIRQTSRPLPDLDDLAR